MSDDEIYSPRKGEVSSLRGAEPKRKGRGKGKPRAKSPVKQLPFFETDEFSDVTIVVGDKRLYSNKCLLCYNSPVFHKELGGESGGGGKGKGGSKGGGSKDLDLSEKKFDIVCDLLSFIDPRVETNFTDEEAARLLPLAEEYEIKPLIKSCEWTITQAFYKMRRGRRAGLVPTDVTIRNLVLADKYKMKDLQEMCVDELVAGDSPYTGKLVSENEELSEHMKRLVLERKLEKVNDALARERRLRAENEQPKDKKGGKIWRK